MYYRPHLDTLTYVLYNKGFFELTDNEKSEFCGLKVELYMKMYNEYHIKNYELKAKVNHLENEIEKLKDQLKGK